MRARMPASTALAAAAIGLACAPLREFPNLATSDGSAPPPLSDAGEPPRPADTRGAEPDTRPGDAPAPAPDMSAVRGPDVAPRPPDAAPPPVARDGGVPVAPAAGSFTAFPLVGYARDIVLGADGNLYFSHFENKIGKVTPAGEVLQGVFTLPGLDPYHIVPTSDGALWVAGAFDNAIGRLAPDGSLRTFEIDSDDTGPDDLTLGPDGNFWFTQAGGDNWIGRMTPAGQYTRFDLGDDQPNGITTGPDGNLWFTIYVGSLGRITPAGRITRYPMPGDDELGLMNIVRGPDGNLWFTQRSVMKIGRITPAGTISEIPLPRPGATGEPWLDGIIVGPDGNLWYGGAEPPVIGRITPAGVITEFRAPENLAPERLTFDRNGALWFTNDDGVLGRFIPPRP
jgi:streptogramin lyase